MILEASAPPPAPVRPRLCRQRIDLGGPIVEYAMFEGHAWIIDQERFSGGMSTPITLTRSYRCLRCGATWAVTGEPSPAYFTG